MIKLKFIGDWGLGIGDWGLGIGPIPNPPFPLPIDIFFFFKYFIYFYMINQLLILKLYNKQYIFIESKIIYINENILCSTTRFFLIGTGVCSFKRTITFHRDICYFIFFIIFIKFYCYFFKYFFDIISCFCRSFIKSYYSILL